MLTNKDVEKLKETFATREDLKQFATKEDFKKSAEETKRHFDVVAEDLKNSITLLAEHVSTKNSRVDEHEEKIETLKTDVSVLKSRMAIIEAGSGK